MKRITTFKFSLLKYISINIKWFWNVEKIFHKFARTLSYLHTKAWALLIEISFLLVFHLKNKTMECRMTMIDHLVYIRCSIVNFLWQQQVFEEECVEFAHLKFIERSFVVRQDKRKIDLLLCENQNLTILYLSVEQNRMKHSRFFSLIWSKTDCNIKVNGIR